MKNVILTNSSYDYIEISWDNPTENYDFLRLNYSLVQEDFNQNINLIKGSGNFRINVTKPGTGISYQIETILNQISVAITDLATQFTGELKN